jgi:hypothetical protein
MFLRSERHGRRGGRGGRAKAIEMGEGSDAHGAPGAATLEGAVVPARQVENFAVLVTVGGIVLVALTQIGWRVLVRLTRDLIAWDNGGLADLRKELRRQRKAKVSQRAAS